jgi:acetyl-CoA acyltransferase
VKDMGFPFPKEMFDRYEETGLPPQGIGADMIAVEYGFSREDLDAFGAQSQQRAVVAVAEGRFDREIVPVPIEDGMATKDQGVRDGTTIETLSALKPAFKEDGLITAGNSSQICDGASAVLIMSAEKAKELGMKPRARFHAFALAGTDPVTMLKGPIPATKKILEKTGMSINDIDLFEVNEAFASVVLAWAKELGADMSKVNVNGGAIALGHPLGGSGTKLMATLLNELERTGGRFGLQVMCEGGGLANATIIERLD